MRPKNEPLNMKVCELVLSLIDKAIQQKLMDIAKEASNILIENVPQEYAGDILIRLCTRYVDMGAEEEIKALLNITDKGKLSRSGRLTGTAVLY